MNELYVILSLLYWLISITNRSFFIGTIFTFSTIFCTSIWSWVYFINTVDISVWPERLGTLMTRSNTEMSSRCRRWLAREVVPMMSSLVCRLLGCFLIRTRRVYRMVLLKRGPWLMYSTRRSMLSIIIQARGDLYASMNTFTIACTFWFSDIPTYFSGVISFTKGNPQFRAVKAARAVLPEPRGPSRRTECSWLL